MTTHLLVALSNAVEGGEAEYDEWINGSHIPEMLSVPGFVAAQRYEATHEQRSAGAPPFRFVTLYELDTADIGQTLSALAAAFPAMTKTTSSDLEKRALLVVKPLGPRRISRPE